MATKNLGCQSISSLKTNMSPEHVGWKMYSLLKCSLFKGHICFAGCMSMILVQKGCNLDFLYWLVDKGVVNLKIVFCFVGFTDSTKSLVVIIVVISTQTLGQMIQFDEFTFQMGGSTSIPKQSDLKFQDSYRTTWVIH